MKLLLDQNLSRRIPSLIADIFPGSNHVGSLALDRVSDQEIWDFAESEGYVILSKDSDFHQMSLVRYTYPLLPRHEPPRSGRLQ
jgi:predicted nuclease of predicted toxin-antitoxin system